MFKPRPYQQKAIDAAKEELRQSIDPILIEAATGAGKSLLIAYLAEWLHEISAGKKVLCLAPQRELVLQNAAKYKALGAPCSIFSASAGAKSTRYPVVFGSPGTVSRSISRFLEGYCAVVIDEAHGITPTIKGILEAMQAANPRLRIIGTTATPFRLGSGYIYRIGPDGKANSDDTCRDPFFLKCVDRIQARDLIEQGYLTRPVIAGTDAEAYDTSGLQVQRNGHFAAAAVDQAFVGHGRKTASIVADVVSKSQDAMGVVFFAATIQHGEEILASLPPGLSALITGATANREAILKRFEARKLKYLVNVGVLTTGWDCAHVDVIAILRKTESVGLLQQIIGRGLRLHPDKRRVRIMDFAGNIAEHCPYGDLFAPIVRARGAKQGGGIVKAECPTCGYENEFSRHKDAEGYEVDKAGYCLDVWGTRVETDYGPMPAHHGRRCFGMVRTGLDGKHERCNFRWTAKPCDACGADNDIAARYCATCKAELVDPNEKLQAEFQAHKRDPYAPQTDEVLSMVLKESVSQRGNPTVRADWVTPHRKFSTWHQPEASFSKAKADWSRFEEATRTGPPATISYVKDQASSFFRILAFNQPADAPEDMAA